MAEAKPCMDGGSQVVRPPMKFRFAGESVSVHRNGGREILEPIDAPIGRPVAEVHAWLQAIQTMAGEGFDRASQGADQERD